MGHRLSASVDLVVDCKQTVADGRHVAEHVRHAPFHEVRGLDMVAVHIDPCDCGEADAHVHTRDHDQALPPRQAGGSGEG